MRELIDQLNFFRRVGGHPPQPQEPESDSDSRGDSRGDRGLQKVQAAPGTPQHRVRSREPRCRPHVRGRGSGSRRRCPGDSLRGPGRSTADPHHRGHRPATGTGSISPISSSAGLPETGTPKGTRSNRARVSCFSRSKPSIRCWSWPWAGTRLRLCFRTRPPFPRMRGKFFPYRGGLLIPTFHPSYLLRNPRAKRQVWEDMKAIRAKLTELGSSYYPPGPR